MPICFRQMKQSTILDLTHSFIKEDLPKYNAFKYGIDDLVSSLQPLFPIEEFTNLQTIYLWQEFEHSATRTYKEPLQTPKLAILNAILSTFRRRWRAYENTCFGVIERNYLLWIGIFLCFNCDIFNKLFLSYVL